MNENNPKILSEIAQKNDKDREPATLTKEDTVTPTQEQERKLVTDVATVLDKLRNKFPQLTGDEIKSMVQTLKEKEKAENSKLPELLDFPEETRAVLTMIQEQRKTILQTILEEKNTNRFLTLCNEEISSLYKTIDAVLDSDVKAKFGENAILAVREQKTNDFWISQEIAAQEAEYYSKIRDKAYQLYDGMYSYDQRFVDYTFKAEHSTLIEDVSKRKQEYVNLITQSKFLAHGTTRVMNVLSQGALLTREKIQERTGIDQFNTGQLKAPDQELHDLTFSLDGIWPRYAGFDDGRVSSSWKKKGKPMAAGVFLYPITNLLNGMNQFYSADGLHIIPPDGVIPLSDLRFVTDEKNWRLMTGKQRTILEDAEGESYWAPQVETVIENDALTPDEAKVLESIMLTSQENKPVVFTSDANSQFGVTNESVRKVENIARESYQSPEDTQGYQIFPTGKYEKSLGGYIDTLSFHPGVKT